MHRDCGQARFGIGADERSPAAVPKQGDITFTLVFYVQDYITSLPCEKIRLHFDSSLTDVDFKAQEVTVWSSSAVAGASMSVASNRAAGAGISLLAGARRLPSEATVAALAAAAAGVPDWDTAAAEAAALAAGRAFSGRESRVRYDLLVGADGAESTVRGMLEKRKKKRAFDADFEVQTSSFDDETFKGFSGLPVAAAAASSSSTTEGGICSKPELVPGFATHGVRQYLYRLDAPAGGHPSPRLELWVSEPGVVSGILLQPSGHSWAAAELRRSLSLSFGEHLPVSWIDGIVAQASTEAEVELKGRPPQRCGSTVQVRHLGPPPQARGGLASEPGAPSLLPFHR